MLKSAKAVIASQAAQRTMVNPLSEGPLQGDPRRLGTYTTTGLKRWSCQNKDLPSVSDIKAIHVYDFDNTLFSSPLPNPQLWAGPSLAFLQSLESFTNGGWWHDARILQATGAGIEVEEPRGWKGWWNEQIVKLVEISMKQKDALTVLLTGRGETNFASTIKRIVASRGLQFDLVCLKPEVGPNNQRFATTMKFKQNFLEDLVLTYQQADEIRVYEDRVRHVKGFREFFEKFNKELLASSLQPRQPIVAEVIQVAEGLTYLDPVTETAEVQHMMNAHNLSLQNPSISSSKSRYTKLRIKRTFFYTGYILSATDSSRLIDHLLAPQLPPGLAESGDIKFMANNVLITPRPPSKSILDKVGGFGKKMKWQITGTALWENKIWAARVAPVPETATYYSENPVPVIVLGLRKGARPIDASRIQNWQPVPPEKALVFDSTVGEKVLLRIEEDSNEGEWESLFLNKSHKRRQPYQNSREDDNYSRPRGNRESGGYQGANNYDHPPNARHQHHQQQQHQRHAGGDGGRHHNPHHDDGPRRGSGSNYRGRGRGGRGNRGGNQGRGGGRGRGRGGGGRDGGNLGGPPGYRSLDDYGSGGYDGTGEERGGGGNGGGAGPVMNY